MCDEKALTAESVSASASVDHFMCLCFTVSFLPLLMVLSGSVAVTVNDLKTARSDRSLSLLKIPGT